MKPRHLLLAVLVTAIWGLNYSVIKIGLKTVDPFVLAGIRFSLCALPALFFVKKPDTPWRLLIGYGLVFGVGLWGVVNLGIKLGISAGIASLVLQLSAFFTMLLGALMFREKLSGFQYTGIAIALLGLVCVIFISDGTVTTAGLALVLGGAFSWSVANVIIKRASTREMLGFLVWSSAFAPIPLFALAYLANGPAGFVQLGTGLDTAAVLSVLFQAYPNTVFGYWVWNSLLKQYPVSTVAPLTLLVPIFGLLGSSLIFAERVVPAKLLSIVLIILGLVIGLYGKRMATAWLRKPATAHDGHR